MGCSPSKGNFGALGATRKGRMLPAPPQESSRDVQLEDRESHSLTASTNCDVKEKKTSGQSQVFQKDAPTTPQKKKSTTEQVNMEAVHMDKLGNQSRENSTLVQKKEKALDKPDLVDKKTSRKPKKTTKGAKGLKKKEKDKDKLLAGQKVDFPEPLVKAHQAAYAFLNPSMNRYDILLGLLEQATNTQSSVQPMVAFMALRYEEMTQGLEEMADEGEKLLKENGEHLAWPSQMKNLSSSPPLKYGSANTEPPPDLLQQLLQYTTQRMQNVSQTVGRIGDCALEEAVEYFASVSELLEEKLKVKRAAESRLMQLLSRIEMASLRKPGPEDSALFSEDSGIGAEYESLAGSERRLRRESCESFGTNRTTPVSPMGHPSMNIRRGISRQKLVSQISPSVSLTSLNSLSSTCTIMANDQRDSLLGSVSLDDGEDEDEEEINRGMVAVEVALRQRSNSSPVESAHQRPCRLSSKRIENPQNVEMTLRMKNAMSGKIQFVSSQNASAKTKVTCSPKTSRREWSDEKVSSIKRPQTAAPIRRATAKKTAVTREQRSRSADSLRSKGEDPTLLELERTQKDLNQRLQKMNKGKGEGNTKNALPKQKQGFSVAQTSAMNRQNPTLDKNNNGQLLKEKLGPIGCTNKKQEVATEAEEDTKKDIQMVKTPLKATPPPSPPASPRPSSGFQRGRNSVKRLIDTFSQGIEEMEGPKVLGPLKGVRKCGVPVLPGIGNVEYVLSGGITSCRPESTSTEKTDDLDLDNLPPPPLEVLMDNSYEGAQSLLNGNAVDGSSKVGKSPMLHRLKASVQSVLPSKRGFPQTSKFNSQTNLDQQDTPAREIVNHPDFEGVLGAEKHSSDEQNAKLFQQKNSSVFQSDGSTRNYGETNGVESTGVKADGDPLVPGPTPAASTVPPSTVATHQPPSTQPVSRVRFLPSTPSTQAGIHRRLPSPQTVKKPWTPLTAASPPVNRRLPTPPAVQKRLPSPSAVKQNSSNTTPGSFYSFKSPSPPASPKVQKWSRENSSEDQSSVRVNNVRSVFCPVSPSLFEAQACPAPEPPQTWASTRVSFLSRTWEGRGRFPVPVQGPRPYIRRSQSDRRPSLNVPTRSKGISVAETCGSEPTICSQGLDDEPTGEEELWSSQSDLRATRSTSHPDLCVVGQALHRS